MALSFQSVFKSISVLLNRNISKPVVISKGCWQGCPLSLLLFALAIEPLATAIKSHTQVEGITVGLKDPKTALYADDI